MVICVASLTPPGPQQVQKQTLRRRNTVGLLWKRGEMNARRWLIVSRVDDSLAKMPYCIADGVSIGGLDWLVYV